MAERISFPSEPVEENMSLIDFFKSPCVALTQQRTPDGEGGYTTQWTEGRQFDATIILDASSTTRRAEKDSLTNQYTVTVDKGVALNFHDVFRRTTDNRTFRVTSNASDKQTPACATFQFAQVTAEEWRLTE